MTGTIAMSPTQRFAGIVPAASHQIDPSLDVLDSTTAGVLVLKSGQLRSQYRNEGRVFARELAKHVNRRQGGKATALVYEETFGYEDRLHWLIHLQGLQTYYDMVEMGDQDRAYRESVAAERVADAESGGAWDRLFLDGSMRSDVLLPLNGPAATPAPLNSATAGIVVHRVAQPGYGMRAEALEVAAELTAALNADAGEEVGAVCFEEAFGPSGRLHWLIHLRDLTAWDRVRRNPAFRSEGRPGVFVDSGRDDIALTPHHWGLYATTPSHTP
ncbi:DUF6039 family protein [Jatrophihabitans sp.]|jgi:hypothetical protein|uniref:DUF6039 family protein n=1 Tax=Jatrophihabitans sp. TaxID=1932789 RepID=UPI002EFD9BF8